MTTKLDKWREEAEQKDRELQLAVLRRVHRKKLHDERHRLSLGQRIDKALLAASVLSSAPAAGTGDRRREKPGSRKPPSASNAALMHGTFDLGTEYARRLELMVQRLEDEVFNYKFRQVGGGSESYEDRIARLLTYEGLSDAEVAYIDYKQGTVRTIKYERRKRGFDSAGRKLEAV